MYDDIRVRIAREEDAAAILAIYAPYIITTAVTFEYEIPAIDEFVNRIRQIKRKYPLIAAEVNGEIVGYAYAGNFHNRAAYRWAAETSIYVEMNQKRRGIGSRLYEVLEGILKMQGILNLNACIAFPEEEDEYLTRDSVVFHEKNGYQLIGEFHKCGYKFNRWYNIVWMEKQIGIHLELQPEVKTFEDISACIREMQWIS